MNFYVTDNDLEYTKIAIFQKYVIYKKKFKYFSAVKE